MKNNNFLLFMETEIAVMEVRVAEEIDRINNHNYGASVYADLAILKAELDTMKFVRDKWSEMENMILGV